MENRIEQAVADWGRHGWALVDGLLPAPLIEQACSEVLAASADQLARPGPTRRPELAGQTDRKVKFRGSQFDGTTLFPFPSAPTLNRLFVHRELLALAAALLATDDLRIYQSRVWSKYGDHTDYEQPHHRDTNHSLIPIRHEPGWGHVEMFVYLHDIDESTGAPRAAIGQADGLGGAGTGGVFGRDERPDLYRDERAAVGSAGSVFAYRSDVWHRGIDIPPGNERHVMVVAFRPASVDWIGFDAHEPIVSNPDWVRFAEASTPDELALFGVPRPGHAFWTTEVLDAMAAHYRGLDLSPWRNALPPTRR